MKLRIGAAGAASIGAVAFLSGCHQTPPKQFDLVCTGTSNSVAQRGLEQARTGKQFTHRYRIDLARGLWCADECKSVQQLGEIRDNNLSLMDQTRSDSSGEMRAQIKIDRLTGALKGEVQARSGGAMETITANGSCEKQAFSGLPKQKF